MKHLTEEEMMEQAYGESWHRTAVERHLEACGACAEAFAELRRDLDELERVEAPARDAGYGQRVWEAIAPSLPAYAAKRSWWKTSWVGRPAIGLGYAAACALVIAGAFYAGRVWEQKKQPPQAAVKQTAPAPQTRQPIVVVVLDEHLDRSERFLVQLKHADASSAEMVSPMRDEARRLLAANRICRQKAAQTDDPELNIALDHLDRLLGEMANEPGGLNADAIARLQDEMNSDGLLFEVRVLRSRRSSGKGAEGSPPQEGTV